MAAEWVLAVLAAGLLGAGIVGAEVEQPHSGHGRISAVDHRWPTAPSARSTPVAAGRPATPQPEKAAQPSPETSTTLTLTEGQYSPGDCVTWDLGADAFGQDRQTEVVPCSRPHLIEIVAPSQQINGLGDGWPGGSSETAYSFQHCDAPAQAFLGRPVDPYGRFTVGAILPTEDSWLNGDRTLWCGLQSSAGTDTVPVLFSGEVKGADQTLLEPIGTCLPDDVIKAVPCSSAHALEVTADVALPSAATSPPSAAQYQSLVAAACEADSRTYAGGSLPTGAAVGWLAIPAASWAAGRRTVQCVVGDPGANGNWTTITVPLPRI